MTMQTCLLLFCAALVKAAFAAAAAESAISRRVELRLDRPFYFVIEDRDRGAMLFVGRIGNPGGRGVPCGG